MIINRKFYRFKTGKIEEIQHHFSKQIFTDLRWELLNQLNWLLSDQINGQFRWVITQELEEEFK